MFGLGDEVWRRGWVQEKEAFTLPASRPRSVYTACRRLRVTTALSVNPVTGSEKDNVFLWTMDVSRPPLFSHQAQNSSIKSEIKIIFSTLSSVVLPLLTSSFLSLSLRLSPLLLRRRNPSRRLPFKKQQKKKWEKQELNKNGNPVRVAMHVKAKDKVVVIAGADKGKVTEVVELFTKSGEILCKDVNVKTKHVKPKGEGETGQIIQREFPIAHSNVMHWSEEKKVRSRIGHKMEDGKKVRFLKKTGEVLAN